MWLHQGDLILWKQTKKQQKTNPKKHSSLAHLTSSAEITPRQALLLISYHTPEHKVLISHSVHWVTQAHTNPDVSILLYTSQALPSSTMQKLKAVRPGSPKQQGLHTSSGAATFTAQRTTATTPTHKPQHDLAVWILTAKSCQLIGYVGCWVLANLYISSPNWHAQH